MNISPPRRSAAEPDRWSEDAREPGTPSHGGLPVDLRGLFGLLKRQFRLIALTAVAILVLAAIVLSALTPTYRATALIMVDTARENVLSPEAQIASAGTDNARVDSEVEILRSDGVLIDVIASQSLVEDEEFGVRLGLRERAMAALRLGEGTVPTGREALAIVLSNLRGAVSVQRRGLTYLVAVQISSRSPEKAAGLANAMVDAYIARQVDSKIAATLVRRDAIGAQVERARVAVVESETRYNNFVFDNLDQFVSITGQANLRAQRDVLEQLTSEQASVSGEVEGLRQGLQRGDWTALADQLQSEATAELERQRESLRAALGEAAVGSEEDLNLRDELTRIEQSFAEVAQTRISELQTSLANAESELAAARQEVNTQLLRADLPPDIQARIYELLQISRNATTSYQTLLSRLQDLDTQALLQVADSRVVSPALAPVSPSFPNVPLILATAGLVAVGAGVGLGILFDNFVGGFTSAEQLSAVTRRRLATVIPVQKPEEGQISVADTIVTRPISRYAESIRRMRTMIDRSIDQRQMRGSAPARRGSVVMVSSALPSEGKTTVALSLARTYAADGKRTLLIDCDLRRPSVHRQLGIDTEVSLADFLSGDVAREAVPNIPVVDPRTSLKVIPGRRHSATATDRLLKHQPFAQFIEAAANLFDVLVLDTPPIEFVVDGLYVAEHADVIAFVVRAGSTSQTSVAHALGALEDLSNRGTETLVVLNRQQVGFSVYDGASSGYYSE